MTFSQAPWFVNGANIPAQLARNLLQDAVMGHEGVIGPSHCKVTQSAVPDTNVQIADGGLVVKGRAQVYQGNYADYNIGSAPLAIPATTASPRSDLVCVRVQDPQYEGALNPAVDNIIFPFLITNVPAGSQTLADAGQSGLSAVVLARLDLPASTSVITNAYVTDLRRLCWDRRSTLMQQIIHGSASGSPAVAITPPAAPSLATAGTGGTILAGTYTVALTYVSASGETVASATAQITTTGSTSTITITSPASAINATGWYAYVSQPGGSTLFRQQAPGSPTAIGTNLVLTAPPTNTGANPPTLNTSVALTAWPSDCGLSSVRVPDWANTLDVRITVQSPNATGSVQGSLAITVNGATGTVISPFNVDADSSLSSASTFDVTSLADTNVALALTAAQYGTGSILADLNTSAIWELTFRQVVQ